MKNDMVEANMNKLKEQYEKLRDMENDTYHRIYGAKSKQVFSQYSNEVMKLMEQVLDSYKDYTLSLSSEFVKEVDTLQSKLEEMQNSLGVPFEFSRESEGNEVH